MVFVRKLNGNESGLGFFYSFLVSHFVYGVYRMLQTTGQANAEDESTGVRKLSILPLFSLFLFVHKSITPPVPRRSITTYICPLSFLSLSINLSISISLFVMEDLKILKCRT